MKHSPINYCRTLTAVVIFALSGYGHVAFTQVDHVNQLQRAFERPPDDSRIMMHWWWFGPAGVSARP